MALSLSQNCISAGIGRVLPNFVNAFIFTRYSLGLLNFIFCLFVTELWLLIDIRIWFLLNIFRIWPFYIIKVLQRGSLIILVSICQFSKTFRLNTHSVLALTICESRALFFVSSWCSNLNRVFLHDDILH